MFGDYGNMISDCPAVLKRWRPVPKLVIPPADI